MNDRHEYTLAEYAAMDRNNLTVNDVKGDAEYIRKRGLLLQPEYMGITAPVFRGMKRAKPEDKAALFDALADYFLDGKEPDYDALTSVSPMAATLADVAITAHEARFEKDIIRRYKSYVGGKITQAKAAGLTPPEDTETSF